MMDRQIVDDAVLAALSKVKGIRKASPLPNDDYQKVLSLEEEAEKKSLMGLGKVINTGVREVLACDTSYVALTTMEFDWGCNATLILKKGEDIVGEEVRDEETIEKLSKDKNVWFMHKNFVIYKDKISFPQDIMKKICHFEIPCLPAEWCLLEKDKYQCHAIIFANPSTLCDIHLKETYFNGIDEQGLGTILLGLQ
jgi:hypothetical protein